MKKMLIFATSYPYTAGILAIIWMGSALLLTIDSALSLPTVLCINVVTSGIIAVVGFRK